MKRQSTARSFWGSKAPVGTLLAGALLLGPACQSGADVPDSPPESATVSAPVTAPGSVEDTVVEPAAEPSAENGAENGIPADVDTIASLLRARHADDLPTVMELREYATADASLRWLAVHGESALMKTRATSLLQFSGGSETAALLRSFLEDSTTHPTLRAAAIIGMNGQDLGADDASFVLVADALNDADPRVTQAAVDTLASEERGMAVLWTALEEATLSEATLAQIRSAIGPQ